MAIEQKQLNFEVGFNNNYIDVHQNLPSNEKLDVISLFSGCGGMDMGFEGDFKVFERYYEKNNYNIVFANDINEKACTTYNHNFSNNSVCKDIRELVDNNIDDNIIPKADVVIGGFPCQDFSLAGKREGLKAKRGRLYYQMKRVVDYSNPQAFIAENVDGLRIQKGALLKILDDFKCSGDYGYDVKFEVLNSANYGVPQKRKRVIIIGIRKDLNKKILFPQIVRFKNSKEKPWMTAKKAIDDLWDKIGDLDIYNHGKRSYSKAKFYPGKNFQGNKQIKSNEPSCTIRAEHHGNIEGHYRTQDPENPDDMSSWRRLSVRECARLQSFPDDFEFKGSTTAAYKQVGNAVPPILAWSVARAVYFSLFSK